MIAKLFYVLINSSLTHIYCVFFVFFCFVCNHYFHKLSKVTADDCQLFDDFMTEYSRYEHSQPHETPIALPQPDKLEADINKVLVWVGEFEKR